MLGVHPNGLYLSPYKLYLLSSCFHIRSNSFWVATFHNFPRIVLLFVITLFPTFHNMPLPTHFPPVLPIIAGKRTLSENARMHFTVQQVHTYYSMAYLHSVFFWSYTLVPWCKSSSFTPQTLNGLRIFGWVSYSDLPKRSYPNHPLTFYAEPVGRTGSCSCRSGVLRGEVCVEVSLVFRLELSNSFYSRGCIRRCGLLD